MLKIGISTFVMLVIYVPKQLIALSKKPPRMPSDIEAVPFILGFVLRAKINYSVRRATTGSFFAALLAGIRPDMQVSPTLSSMSSSASSMGRAAILS